MLHLRQDWQVMPGSGLVSVKSLCTPRCYTHMLEVTGRDDITGVAPDTHFSLPADAASTRL